VFVRADDIDRPQFVSEVNNARGVVELLSNNHVPVRVPDVAIAKLIKAESDGRFDQTKEPFNPGERVRVMQGPLAVTEPRIGEFVRRRNAERVVVLLSMLGLKAEVDVNLDWIEKA
jgi:transcription antitermination factor NusG